MKERKIKVAASAKFEPSGKVTFNYIEIPVKVYEAWLKRCYELGS